MPTDVYIHENLSVKVVDSLTDIANHVDLLSGTHIWEASVDLARYLSKSEIVDTTARVLEIGCGHGIPSISHLLCRKKQISALHLQDMSSKTLEEITAKNLILNDIGVHASDTRRLDFCIQYHHGSWNDLTPPLPSNYFDLIIASEVMYMLDSYDVLENLIRHCLNRGGCFIFSGKKYYFGTGGGIDSFVLFMKTKGYRTDLLLTIDDGNSNIRQIAKVTKALE